MSEYNISFSLQKICIPFKEFPETEQEKAHFFNRIKEALDSYRWIYQNEGSHHIAICVMLPAKFEEGEQRTT